MAETTSPTVDSRGSSMASDDAPSASAYEAKSRRVIVIGALASYTPREVEGSAGNEKPRRCRGSTKGRRSSYASDSSSASFSSSSMEMFATIARSSFEGLNTGTGRAETSTGEPVRGLRAMRVFR